MNTRSNKNYSILLLLAGTLLVGFSMGRWLFPLAAWIGPVLIMRYARDHKVGQGFLSIIAAYFLAFLIGFGAIWVSFGNGPLFAIILAVFYGLLWSLPYLADRLAGRRLTGFASTLVYPLVAATLEFVNIYTNPVGMWGATGFTQYGDLPLMQLASVTGMIGITFLLGWFASVANWAWENRMRGAKMLRGLAAFGGVVAAVYLFGFLRLNLAPTIETVRVAGITASPSRTLSQRLQELPDPDLASPAARPLIEAHWDAYFNETTREAQAGAKVVVWPELAGVGLASDEASHIARAQEVARQNGIYLAIPLLTEPNDSDSGQLSENKLLVIDPVGEIVMEHVKYGGRIFERNRIQGDGKLQTVDTPFGVLSGIICYDADYPAIVQQSGQNSTGLLLVPSSDWLEIHPLHTYMAVFRAIENGMSLVRQVEGGESIAVDPYGRVLAQTNFFGSTDRTLVAQVPVKHVPTLYTSIGNWFEWLLLAGFLFTIVWALVAGRKEN
ncbi:MAG: apolipoprotein N-acyltransferase [Chloroflexota bacterium]|nr:MAG: apolipoprotein N-acyltransferase [Chloroflexota bacterium]